MNKIWLLTIGMSLLAGCSENRKEAVNHETEIRETMTRFLTEAVNEFEDELGSWTDPWGPGDARWEGYYVESDLMSLASREYARLMAFDDGLKYERVDPPELKPPTPRSLWLPIPPEGSYTFQLHWVSNIGDKASVSVRFTMHIDEKTYDEGPVEYKMGLIADRWQITNVVGNDGFNLRSYLQRPHVMEDWIAPNTPLE